MRAGFMATGVLLFFVGIPILLAESITIGYVVMAAGAVVLTYGIGSKSK
jgi:hypothetical protein